MKKKKFKDGQKDGQKKVDAPDDVNVQAETTWQAFDHYVAETPDGVVSVEAFGVEAAWQEYKALFKQRRSNNETKRIKGFATEREMLLKMEKLMNILKEFLGEPSGYRCDKPACCEWWEHDSVDGVCPHVICMGSCWAEWTCAHLVENEM